MDKQELPILIIGAGLAGLALANALHTNNVPFQVYDRDESPAFRAQGYRIRIQDFYLRQLLPKDLWEVFENACGDVLGGMGQVDAFTAEKVPFAGFGRVGAGGNGGRGGPGGPGPAPTGGRPRPLMTEGTTMNVDRVVLRNLMMAPMVEAGMVSFSKRFVRYEETADGGIIAVFADGTSSVKGRLLIGADGARSKVRKQLAPEFKVLDTEGRAIFGKSLLTHEFIEKIPQAVLTGLTTCSDATDPQRPVRLFCDTMRFSKRGNLRQQKFSVEVPEDYLYWVLCMRKDKLDMNDEEFMALSKKDAIGLAMKMTNGWHDSCREIIAANVHEASSTLAFATSHPSLVAWTTNPKVTLMGDAAHPMMPVGGIGANAAFRDATLLLKAVVDGGSMTDLVNYENAMLERTRDFVVASVGGAANFFGMRPIEQLSEWRI